MLQITIPSMEEYYDERIDEFITGKEQTIQLEHSLISLSKWEAKWHKPFLSRDQKTDEETLDYIRCMTLTKNVDPTVYSAITPEISAQIERYINDPMTATWFRKDEKGGMSREIITSEVIYYWMVTLQIPFECEKWHLNRLLALIQVCNAKNGSDKKMSKKDIMRQNRELNAARRNKLRSKG